jgi:hypothetical protein
VKMNYYHYLISSLYELIIDSGRKTALWKEFHEFCEDQLKKDDFNEFKKLFLMNDIKNAVNYKKKNDPYKIPSYYPEEEFIENLKEPVIFFDFLQRYFQEKKQSKRSYPEMLEIDELVLFFYEDLKNIAEGFIYEYFLFELDLRNITTAFSCRKSNIDFTDKIIPFGENAEQILKNRSGDFGLGREIDFIDKLALAYDSGSIVKIEKAIEDARWNWLDSRIRDDFFSFEAVLAYTVKIQSVLRWMELSEEKGREILNKLLGQIKSGIKFQDEFLSIGGKQ